MSDTTTVLGLVGNTPLVCETQTVVIVLCVVLTPPAPPVESGELESINRKQHLPQV